MIWMIYEMNDIVDKINEILVFATALELDEGIDKKLFALGREVNSNLPHESGLKPSKEQFEIAAKKLGIPVSKAIKAWNEFTWN